MDVLPSLRLPDPGTGRAQRAWEQPGFWPSLDAATAELDPPFGVLHLPALAHNAHDLTARAASARPGGVPIRVASKSVRVRAVLDAVLALPGYRGVLAYTLPEALWLSEWVADIVVGYPTADRAAIRALGTDPRAAERIVLMVDDVAQLDLIDSVLPSGRRETIRLALELDAAYESPLLGRLGVWRSPVRTAGQAAELAQAIVRRPGFELVGMMAYEAQVAGVGNRPPGHPLLGRVIDGMQRRSIAELAQRRAEAVAAVGEVTQLRFVNGGGTGSIESSAADPSVTEVAAGSGLFGPHLFDTYSAFRPAPAAAFALPVARRPRPDIATVLGGGWIASGPPAPDRLPLPVWPAGMRYVPREAAGEVQTPLRGEAARTLAVGDRVWFRHTKAGEPAEHLNEFAVVDAGRSGEPGVTGAVPTYRGEGKVFL